MKKIWIHPLFYLAVIPALNLIYILLNHEPQTINTLYTDLDHTIPFLKGFIIPYMIWVPFLYLTLIYFYFKDRQLYRHTLIAYSLSVLICYGIYLMYQTTVPRPELMESDLLSRLVRFVYQNDAPFNCFPSIHCLSSYLLFIGAMRSGAIGRWVTVSIGIMSWGIIISTVFVKQHVVLDVLAGVMLGHIIYGFIPLALGRRIQKTRKSKKEVFQS